MSGVNVNVRVTLQAWADITLKNWLEKIKQKKIGQSGDLAKSFSRQLITSANGDVAKIKFAFEYYGVMVDMGVGGGTKIGDVKENMTARRLEGKKNGNRRRAKKWKSKSLYADVLALGELMGSKYAHLAAIGVAETIES